MPPGRSQKVAFPIAMAFFLGQGQLKTQLTMGMVFNLGPHHGPAGRVSLLALWSAGHPHGSASDAAAFRNQSAGGRGAIPFWALHGEPADLLTQHTHTLLTNS